MTTTLKERDTVRHTTAHLRTMGVLGRRGERGHWQTKGTVLGVTHYPDYRTKCKTIVTVEWANGYVSRVFPTMLERA